MFLGVTGKSVFPARQRLTHLGERWRLFPGETGKPRFPNFLGLSQFSHLSFVSTYLVACANKMKNLQGRETERVRVQRGHRGRIIEN